MAGYILDFIGVYIVYICMYEDFIGWVYTCIGEYTFLYMKT